MNLLLDTHVPLWVAGVPDRLSEATPALMLNEADRLYFSVASIWGVVIKRRLGRGNFRVDPARLRRLLVMNGYGEVALTSDHALAVEGSPALHRDPFDRVLVAQARVEGMRPTTAHSQVAQYGEEILRA